MNTNLYFFTINFIKIILDSLQIPCEMREIYKGYQLRFPWCEGDIAMHDGTYGAKAGDVESYQFPWDDGDVTQLSPEEATRKIIAYYEEECGGT
jgi:hypothetical protein